MTQQVCYAISISKSPACVDSKYESMNADMLMLLPWLIRC